MSYADRSNQWLKTSCNEEPTPGQKQFLKNNFAYEKNMSKAEAWKEIRRIVALKNKHRRLNLHEPITERQKSFLKHHGIKADAMSKKEAMRHISDIKNMPF